MQVHKLHRSQNLNSSSLFVEQSTHLMCFQSILQPLERCCRSFSKEPRESFFHQKSSFSMSTVLGLNSCTHLAIQEKLFQLLCASSGLHRHVRWPLSSSDNWQGTAISGCRTSLPFIRSAHTQSLCTLKNAAANLPQPPETDPVHYTCAMSGTVPSANHRR